MPLTEAVQNPIVAKFDLVEQGHGSLIALLANAVNRRGQRYLLKNHRLPTVELSAMLGGFARSLERNRLRRRQTGAIPDSYDGRTAHWNILAGDCEREKEPINHCNRKQDLLNG